MRFLLLSILLAFPILLISQKTKLLKIKFKKSKLLKEEYYVLKKNKAVKHGEYTSYFANQNPNKKGKYYKNQKDGDWITYRANGQIKEFQSYIKGKKTGVWLKFIEGGNVVLRFDHKTNSKLRSIIKSDLKYPEQARKKRIEGFVEFLLKFNENCELESSKILKSLSPTCDKEAVRAYSKFYKLAKKYWPTELFCEEKTKTFKVEFSLTD